MKLALHLSFAVLLTLVLVDAHKHGKRPGKWWKRKGDGKVCGSDGKIYDNECDFTIARCSPAESKPLVKLPMRACVAGENGRRKGGKRGKWGRHDKKTKEAMKLCDTDGNTYANKCEFDIANACNKTKFLHNGPCGGECKEDEVCPWKAAMEKWMEMKNKGHQKWRNGKITKKIGIKLRKFGKKHSRDICGSDGQTYDDKCKFMVARCNQHANNGTILKYNKC